MRLQQTGLNCPALACQSHILSLRLAEAEDCSSRPSINLFEWPGWREYELSIGHESALCRWLGLMLLRHKPSMPARYGMIVSQVPSNENITQLAFHLILKLTFEIILKKS